MGIVANRPNGGVNYAANFAIQPSIFPKNYDPTSGPVGAPPIQTTGGTPGYLSFQNNINGLMQAVFSYGGATLFCELMAEMRRPWDFWKGLLAADLLIFCVYLFFGLFVYVSLFVPIMRLHRPLTLFRATKANTLTTPLSKASIPTLGRPSATSSTSSVG